MDKQKALKKNAVIFGDSYSTFEGFVPHGYDIYYSEDSGTDIRNVAQTWWHQLAEQDGLNILLNDSWSGSTIGYTGYDNYDCSKTSSFIFRLEQLIANGFFEENEIHKVFVFGGTNDSWSGAPLGEVKLGGWEKQDLYFVLPAVCCFLQLLRNAAPKAQIYCLINKDLKSEIEDCMKLACREYGITAITFDEIDKTDGHPTVVGMKDISRRVLEVMNQSAE